MATIPVALPLVEATIGADGHITVVVDGETHSPHTRLTRGNLRAQIAALAADRATPLRVQVTQADGRTFTDVILPDDPAHHERPAPAPDRSEPEDIPPTVPVGGADAFRVTAPDGAVVGLTGSGFLPGEHVAFAVIVLRRQADPDGTAVLHLPAALTTRSPGPFLLLGQSSGTLVLADPFGGDHR